MEAQKEVNTEVIQSKESLTQLESMGLSKISQNFTVGETNQSGKGK